MNDSSNTTRNYWKYAFCVLFPVSLIILGLGLKCWLYRTNIAINNFYGEKSYNSLKYDFDAIAKLFLAFQPSISPDSLLNEARKQGLGTMIEDRNGLNRIQVGLAVFAFNRDGKLLWIKQYHEAQ